MINYFQGSSVRVTATFENNAQVPTDPTTITAKIKTPAGVTTAYVYGVDSQLVKDSTGIYHIDVSANAAGIWSYRFEGTGSVLAASQDQFNVVASNP
jgi:hypothetical protein